MINISYNSEHILIYVNHKLVVIKYFGDLDQVLKHLELLRLQIKELGHEVQ